MYVIQFVTCKNRVASMPVEEREAFVRFATFADRLFLDHDMKVDMPDGFLPNEHYVQVAVVHAPDGGDPIQVAAVALLCSCDAIVEDKVHKSDLIVPEKKILLPR